SREADVRRGYRDNVDNWLDSEWKSVFGSVTFNFLDDMASIDVGGRYADIDKDVFVKGVGGTWVFDVTPCAPGPNDHLGGG
ncbi:MAG: hypothetical protein GTO60_02195, partial [Gammaproteobacteria bacterium]|nr:hypothetical protein [Gammaproteobacteria bacterium]